MRYVPRSVALTFFVLGACSFRTNPGLRPVDDAGAAVFDAGGGGDDAAANYTVDAPTQLGAGTAANPTVVTDGVGNSMAAWSTSGGVNWYSRRITAPIPTWSAPAMIPFSPPAVSGAIVLGSDDFGNTLALDRELFDGGTRMRSVFFWGSGGMWVEDAGVNFVSPDSNALFRLNVTSSGVVSGAWTAGQSIVTLTSVIGEPPDVDAGIFVVSTIPAEPIVFDVAADSQREVFVVWNASDNAVHGALVKDGGVAILQELDVHDGGFEREIRIAVGKLRSNPVAVWLSRRGSESYPYVRASQWQAGGFPNSEIIDSATPHSSSQVRVAQSSAGNSIAVWTQTDQTGTAARQIWFNYRPFAAGWSSARQVSLSGGDADDPCVAFSETAEPSRTAWIAWTSSENLKRSVYVARVYDGMVEPPMRIDTNTGDVKSPAIAGLPDGGAVVVWLQQVNSLYVPFATVVRE